MIVWGTKLYGKVDEVPGVGYVATQFGHVFWIPLIPLKSYFVTRDHGATFDGIPLGLWTKSVVVGYARAASLILLALGFGAANALFNPTEQVDPNKIVGFQVFFALGVLALPTYLATRLPWCERATQVTEGQLARRTQAGYDDF